MPPPTAPQLLGAILFALALAHTFATRHFERLAARHPRHAGLFHLLGEVEVVFGFWALVLALGLAALGGAGQSIGYLESRDFTEPMFVFAVMVIAGTRPVLRLAGQLVRGVARALPVHRAVASYFVVLSLVPLLGSFITEPAAMTLAALTLRETLFNRPLPVRLRYATLGVLFVNVSIGGTLTPFAAPPVLMVAQTWHWDTAFLLANLGGRAAVAVVINAAVAALLFRRTLATTADEGVGAHASPAGGEGVPMTVTAVHLLFLASVVATAHHPVVFLGLLLFFLGFTAAYQRHQDPLILREALLVAFFLAGLVVLGGLQAWWLQPLLLRLDSQAVFVGAAALTAITDNAALTYLASLVPGLSHDFQVALVAGAVTGGGLTVIANAPNPAGVALLRGHFEDGTISPGRLFLAALPPTLVAALAFRLG